MGLDDIRASIQTQLELPLGRLLALDTERKTQAEEAERVRFGERALWGASVVMALSLGMDGRTRPAPGADADELEKAWWFLHDALDRVRQAWRKEALEQFDADTRARREEVFGRVLAKLKENGVEIPEQWRAYADHDLNQREERPAMRFSMSVRYAREMGWLEVRDVFTGEWLEVAIKDAPDSWRDMARREKEARRNAA
jgi:hypothetical protein